MIPSMGRKNYGTGFASALTAAAGSIGVIIPPSIPFVLFGVVGSVSIGGLFLAGIFPGIIIGFSLMVASYLILRKKDIERPSETHKKVDLKYLWETFWDAKWALLTPIVVLGGIYASVFTPTEASAIAILYGFTVGKYIHKELSWKNIYDCMVETLKMIGGILYMIGLSVTFAYVLNMERIPNKIAEFILGISENGYIIIVLIMALLYIVGMFIDTISALVILTPILLPITTQIGYDPIHFGVIMVICLAIGYVTPPVGTNLFVASQIGKVSFERVSISAIPFVIAMTIALLIIVFVPFLSMYLPSLM
jgi:C4-dicarboxylate transporter DctM subunit